MPRHGPPGQGPDGLRKCENPYIAGSMTPFLRHAAFVLIGLLMAACRKGENDPLLSLNTRKARLAGEWVVTTGKATLNYRLRASDGTLFIYNESYTFADNGLRLNTNASSAPVTMVGTYLLELSIKKDGAFTLQETLFGNKFKATGTWAFCNGVGEGRKKESVFFNITSSEFGSSPKHIFNRHAATFAYDITELRNKKIVLHSAGKVFMNDVGEYVTCSTEFEFVPSS